MKNNELAILGVILIIIGIIVVLAAFTREGLSSGEDKREIRGGGVIMIGPIPLIFGTDRKSATTAIILALILVVLTYFLLRTGGYR